MTDAVESLRRDDLLGEASSQVTSRTAVGEFSFSVVPANAKGLDLYRQLGQAGLSGPAQNLIWIASWIEASKPDALLAFIVRERKPVFALAVEVSREGLSRVARPMAGTHANGNFPAATEEFLATASRETLSGLFAAIRLARPDIDMIALVRQCRTMEGFRNPLGLLPNRESPNVGLAIDLNGGFDAVLSRHSGKRKSKKHRSQLRKFKAAGGYRHFRADSDDDVDRLLAAFFEMKAARFAKMGIKNVFAEPHVRLFFETLFKSSLAENAPSFVLHGLEIGGKLRAITGMSRAGSSLVCDFCGISDDELTSASPGDFLFFQNIEAACREGYRIFDFSIGDEPYKRQWCDIESRQFDIFVPFTPKGHLAAFTHRAANDAKHFVKQNRFAWKCGRIARGIMTCPSASDADSARP